MSSRGRTQQMPPWQAVALFLTALFLVASVSGLARASTPAIDKAKSEVQTLSELLDQLNQELAGATEDYNYARQQLQDTQAASRMVNATGNQVQISNVWQSSYRGARRVL